MILPGVRDITANDAAEQNFHGTLASAGHRQFCLYGFLQLPNFMPRGSLALPDFPGLFKFGIENGFQNRT